MKYFYELQDWLCLQWRMDDARYVNEFVQKMNVYIENEIIPGDNVIVSYETMNHPLNIHNVKLLVNRLIEENS